MKTKIIGILAIVIAISASAFTTTPKTTSKTMYYWFLISDGIATGHKVPQADATFVQESTNPPSESSCAGGANQCLSGFTSSQVNGSDQLKDNNQIPVEEPGTQN